jgi:hypothetical protein
MRALIRAHFTPPHRRQGSRRDGRQGGMGRPTVGS